ncbi:peptidase domain-containing ABC transporter [Stenotrophomonas lactitubi]|uniref:peptidase domain-containing ABC transporter n=1 Tax=Stenotrophomonas lactitubi TaxID=2045214 RepID=UPI002248F6AB|nr:peptidase domain-containing ABC transporter [Stenotrophomonas lactitubi]MCX2892731.1 peptidase domain-containing ABC transporter [Stenotrophomonas lactitubi]
MSGDLRENDAAPGYDYSRLLNLRSEKRVEVVLQTEQAECGLACISMVAGHHGVEQSLFELREKYPVTTRGMGLQHLIEVLSDLGLSSRPVKYDLSELPQLQLPCILHWKMKHFVVLTKVGREYVTVADPKLGRQKISLKQLDEFATGVALEVEAGVKIERKRRTETVSLRALAGSIQGLGRSLGQVLVLALFLEALMLVVPQQLRMTIDQVLPFSDFQLLHFLGFTFLAVLGLRAVAEAMRKWMLIWISSNINIGWNANTYNQLLRLPLDYFFKRQLGDIVARFGSISVIQQTLTTNFVVVVIDGLMAIAALGLLLYYSKVLAGVVFLFAAAYVLARFLYLRAYEEVAQKQVNVTAAQQGELIESLRGMLTLRLNNKAASRSVRFMNATARVINTSVKFQRLDLFFEIANTLSTAGQRIAVLWIGGYLALSGELTSGTLVAFVIYSDQFTLRFAKLADYAVQFRLLKFHAERIADIALSSPEKYTESAVAGLIGSSVDFSNVKFSYGYGTPQVLDGVSFSVRPGEVVAITGASGSGKSTIAKLLLGVHDHQAGTISVGGVDIRTAGKRLVRDAIGCVMQSDQLFSGTIAENISFFEEDAVMEDIVEAAQRARVAGEIEIMPMGYRTAVGDMGSTLSGGQVQRILLARALYKKPKILVLDEATSQLDLENERLIGEAVRDGGITAIVIAHRPQTISLADRVLEVRGGQMLEIRS